MNLTNIAVLSTFFFVLLGCARPIFGNDYVCVDDVCFQRTIEVEERALELRGAYELDYWGFDVYSAALYTPSNVGTSSVLDESTPKKLVLHYQRDIKAKDIVKATEKGIRSNPNNDYSSLQDSLQKVYGWYENVSEGDRYRIFYTPESGLTIFLNDEEKGSIDDPSFARAFLGIWLSEYPLNEDMRDALVGVGK